MIFFSPRFGKRFLMFLTLLLLLQSTRIQAGKKASYAAFKYKPIRLNAKQLKLSLSDETSLIQTRGGGRRNSPAQEEEDISGNNSNENRGEGIVVSDIGVSSSSEEGEIKVVPGGASEDPSFVEEISSSDSESDTGATPSSPWGQDEPENADLTEEELLEQASELRQQGKVSHDEGDFSVAADKFHKAANLLERFRNAETSSDSEDTATNNFQDEWATCRLHESLCHLKAQDYEGCVAACTSLLDSEDAAAAMIRARAHHRRAKAKVALEDMDGALLDARSAAFLGDRKAVAFYGKLMRETGVNTSGDPLLSSSSSTSSPSPSLSDTSSLLESLLNKSGPNPSQNSGNNFLASSLLSSLGGQGSGGGLGGKGGAGSGSLAKSVLKSLSKKLEDENTHDGICQYLQSTNPVQVQTMAQMAGLELSSNQAAKLVQIAHGITPKTIRKTVKITKRAVWSVKLVRKTVQFINKYKGILFLLMLVQWTKSAISRPIPVPKVKAPRRARTKAQAAAKPKAQARGVAAGGIL